MINNPALDVAIGLIFIYIIYSLLATTLAELISTWFNLRARNLYKGIARMLDDDSNQGFKDESNNSDLEQTEQHLSQLFFKRPEITYLGRKSSFLRRNLPSYIKPATFAKTLINTLDKAKNAEQSLRIIKSKLDRTVPTQEFLFQLIEEAGDNKEKLKLLLEDWFNETMERVTGWYKKRIQLITFIVGLVLAFTMNIDTIAIAKKLSQDKEARIAMVEASSKYIGSLEKVSASDSSKYDSTIAKLNQRVEDLTAETDNIESILSIPRPDYCSDGKISKAFWMNILGCILTGIALSLGAHFWFDLLNKLIKLRGTGGQKSSNPNQTE